MEDPIRNAVDADFYTCVGICRRAWPSFKERESIFHLFCKHFSTTSFVHEEARVVNGFLLGFLSQTRLDVAYIHLVAVDPDAQRRGIASRLYERFFVTARALNRRSVALIVNPDNGASIGFHKRLGFVVDASGETILDHNEIAGRDYNGPGLHMVRFQKTL